MLYFRTMKPDGGNNVPILFLDFDVIIFDDVNPWAIVTSLNPCAPTLLRPDDVISLFIDYAPTPFRPDGVIILMTSPT